MALDLGVALGLGAAVAWGVNDFLAKGALQRTGLVSTVTWINTIGTGLAVPLVAVFPPAGITAHGVALLLGAGISAIVAQAAFYRAFEIGRISVVSPISSIYPAVTVILALVLLAERPGAWHLVGVALALGGTAFVARSPDPQGGGGGWGRGVREALVAMVTLGFLLLMVKLATEEGTGPALPLLVVRSMSALAFGLSATGGGQLRRPDPMAARAVVAMGFLDSSAFLLYSLGVSVGLVSVVSPLSGLYSAITVTLAWALLGERLQRHQVLALVPLLAGVALLSS